MNQFVEKLRDSGTNAMNVVRKAFSWVPGAGDAEVRYHKRLICCKVRDATRLDEVISFLKELGFSDITTREFLGKRGSRIMLEYKLPDQAHRLHVRVYTIENTSYMLVHKEPVPTRNAKDLYFHVRGFLEWINHSITDQQEARARSPDVRIVKYDQTRELSDYEKGCRMFKDITRQDTRLYSILDFYPDDNDFRLFSLTFGNVSKLLPVQMLLNDFSDNERAGDLVQLVDNIQSMLHVMGFSNIQKASINVKLRAMKREPRLAHHFEYVIDILESKGSRASTGIACIVTREAMPPHAALALSKECTGPGSCITWQVSLSGTTPVLDDKYLKKLGAENMYTHATIATFKAFFQHYVESPTSKETIMNGLATHAVIDETAIGSIFTHSRDNDRLLDVVFQILDRVRKTDEWIPLKELKQELATSGADERLLDHVVDFLKNPLIQLVHVDGKRIRSVGNKEEIKLKIGKMKKLLGTIDLHF